MRGRIFSLVLTNLDDICMSYVNWSELRSTAIANTFHRFDVKQIFLMLIVMLLHLNSL